MKETFILITLCFFIYIVFIYVGIEIIKMGKECFKEEKK